MNQLTEDDPLTIPCEFCDDGYYDNGGNDVKCDHCKGLAVVPYGTEEIQIAKGLGLCRKCGGEVPSIFGRFRLNQLCDECSCEIDTSESYGLGIREY